MLVYTITKGNNKSFVYDIYHGIQGEKGDQGIQGEQGIQGVPGTAATIQVGNVTSGATPSVTNVGTSNAAIFDFVLEKGDKGDQGDKGQAAGFGTPTASATALPVGSDPTVSVTASGDPTQKVFAFSFGIPSGGDDNVQADWDQTDTSADDYIKNKPTIPVVATAIAAGDTGYTTGDQVYTALQSAEKDIWKVDYYSYNSSKYHFFDIIKNGVKQTTGTYYVQLVSKNVSGGNTSLGSGQPTWGSFSWYFPASNNPSKYDRSIELRLYSDSSYQNYLASAVIVTTALSVSSDQSGYTTGDQVYDYVDTQVGNINTILQSI